MTVAPSGRRILVLVGGDLSTRAAIAWAARWAVRTGDGIVLFHVIEPDQAMGFGVMQDLMRAEQWQTTDRLMATFSAYAARLTGHPPAQLVREGPLKETVREVLKTEENLSLWQPATARPGQPRSSVIWPAAWARACRFPWCWCRAP